MVWKTKERPWSPLSLSWLNAYTSTGHMLCFQGCLMMSIPLSPTGVHTPSKVGRKPGKPRGMNRYVLPPLKCLYAYMCTTIQIHGRVSESGLRQFYSKAKARVDGVTRFPHEAFFVTLYARTQDVQPKNIPHQMELVQSAFPTNRHVHRLNKRGFRCPRDPLHS